MNLPTKVLILPTALRADSESSAALSAEIFARDQATSSSCLSSFLLSCHPDLGWCVAARRRFRVTSPLTTRGICSKQADLETVHSTCVDRKQSREKNWVSHNAWKPKKKQKTTNTHTHKNNTSPPRFEDIIFSSNT